MKKRLMSLLLVATCMMTAALPVSASSSDQVILTSYGQTLSTQLLQGDRVDYLQVVNFDNDEVIFTVRDQNGNDLATGYVQKKSSIIFNDNSSPNVQTQGTATLFWNSWNYPNNSITDIQLEVTCTGVCDASGYIEVN